MLIDPKKLCLGNLRYITIFVLESLSPRRVIDSEKSDSRTV